MARVVAGVLLCIVIGAVGIAPASEVLPAGPSLLEVRATSPDQVALLDARFDLAEFRDGDRYHVVGWPGDRARLDAAGIEVTDVLIEDMNAPRNHVPFEYRTLFDYHSELEELADEYPGHVRLVVGSETSLEGRPILGVEIAGDVHADDGRPTAYIDGIHHAREWPAGEIPMNFAIELAEGYGVDVAITDLLEQVRVIIVPVVNVDGFVLSRGALIGEGYPIDYGLSIIGQGSYWRKNVRGLAHAAGISVGSYGVDNNRNYGYLWGARSVGPLARTSPFPLDQTYHGAAPFSEPETRVARELQLTNNVVAAISNHTYGNFVLYPWGHTFTPPPDEGVIDLAHAMAAENGYRAQPGIELYPTHGTANDWTYATLGAYAYIFEITPWEFHPLDGLGVHDLRNRRAYRTLLEWAADQAHHSVLTGTVVAGADPVAASLRLTKTVETPLAEPLLALEPLIETIDLSMTASPAGTFEWHVNPSTRPIAGETEAYQLTVSAPGSQDVTLDVVVARGEVLDLGTIELLPA